MTSKATTATLKPNADPLTPEMLDEIQAKAVIILVELALRWRDSRGLAAASLAEAVRDDR